MSDFRQSLDNSFQLQTKLSPAPDSTSNALQVSHDLEEHSTGQPLTDDHNNHFLKDHIAPIDLDLEAMQVMRSIKGHVNDTVAALQSSNEVFALSLSQVSKAVSNPEDLTDTKTISAIKSMDMVSKQSIVKIIPSSDLENNSIATSTFSASELSNDTMPNSAIQNTTYVDDKTIVLPDRRAVEPDSPFRRFINGLLVGLVYGIVGLIIDWLVNLAKVFASVNSANMVWFFMPMLAVIGLVFGVMFGTKALDVIFGPFRTTPIENNPSNDDDSFSSGLLKAVGMGLGIGVIGWLLMMMLL